MFNFSIYDCVSDKIINFDNGGVIKKSYEIGIDYTALYKLKPNKKKICCIGGRYILSSELHRLFTLVDFDSGEEFICCTNETIFHHLKKDFNSNEAKYVYEIKSGRQKMASICGRVLYLKGNELMFKKFIGTRKGYSNKQDVIKKQMLEKKRLKAPLMKRIWCAINDVGAKKSHRTMDLIGCDLDFFRTYIGNRFTKGMTFDNYGDWHIDHIIPCSSFDLSIISEQRKCFHYTNMQPIWKSNKIAMKYGESKNYIGNYQKSNRDIPIDYKMVKMLQIGSDGLLSEEDAINWSMDMVRNGFVMIK